MSSLAKILGLSAARVNGYDTGGGEALSFATLPELESEADANNFVVEFNNPTPSGNETGAGGGISAPNDVMTQTGGVPGAVSGWRTITNGAQMGFSPTITWVQNFTRNSSGFSMLWHLRNFIFPLNAQFAYLQTTNSYSQFLFGNVQSTWDGSTASAQTTSGGVFYKHDQTDILPSADEAYLLLSVDYINDLSFMGIAVQNTQPTSVDEFVSYCVGGVSQAAPDSDAGFNSSRSAIIGRVDVAANTIGCDIKSLTASLYPSVTKAA